jgi:hypothetical protein
VPGPGAALFALHRHVRRASGAVCAGIGSLRAHRIQPSLLEQLDSQQLNCLNEAAAHGIKAFLTTKGVTPGAYLASDTDEQLLLTIPVRPPPLFLACVRAHRAHAQ